MQSPIKRASCAFASILLTCSSVFAAGGQIFSDITYNNPADMLRVKNTKAEIAYYLVYPIDVNSEGNFVCASTVPGPFTSRLEGKVDSHTSYNLPYFNFVQRCGKWAYGVNLTQPFRTKIDYGTNAVCRYGATDVNVLSYDVQPMVAYQACPSLAIGFGANVQYLRLIFDSQVYLGPIVGDRVFKNEASDTSCGFDVGVNWTPALGTIISANYFSPIIHNLRGDSELVGIRKTTDATAHFDRPWFLKTGIFQAFSQQAGVFVGYTYVHWKFNKKTTAVGSAIPAPNSDILFNFYYNDSHRFDFGARFVSEDTNWMAIVAGYWQNTPTNGIYRNVFLPEGDRSGVTIRLTRKITSCFSVRALYSRSFISDTHIHTVNATGGITQNGTLRAYADTWGLGLTYES